LQRTKLNDCILEKASMRGTNLAHSEQLRTILRGSDMRGATLKAVDLRESDLRDALLAGVDYDAETRWPPGFKRQRLD
jgi:uncharacterized protein YjbI with pentapeptide repeats